MKKIALGSDHGGFELKEVLKGYITSLGFEVEDVGCCNGDSVDYVDYAKAVCQSVVNGNCEKGILVCGTGVGMCIAANKVKGIRAALCADVLTAQLTREHNDSNVLTLGGRIIGVETGKAIVKQWLSTPFSNGERHARRIQKIADLEG